MPGYVVRAKEDGADFLKPDLLCVFCHYLLRKARQITHCGHLYCEECLKEVVNTTKRCVIHDCQVEVSSLDQTFEDRATQRDVLKQRVLCYNSNCPWEGTLKALEEKHMHECHFSEKKCPFDGCGETFDDEKHLNAHKATCSLRVIPCKFAYVGCTERNNKRQLVEHCRDKLVDHLNLLQAHLSSVPVDTNVDTPQLAEIQTGIQTINDMITRYENANSTASGGARSKQASTAPGSKVNVSKMTEKVDALEITVADLQNLVTRHENRVKEFNEQLGKQEKWKEITTLFTRMEIEISRRQQSVQEKEKAIEMKEKATYNGVLLWKISDFNRKRREAIDGRVGSFYSHYFYTSRYGHKLRARIYLNGDGVGRGTHISLFFVVCQSQFDAAILWPFSSKVIMKVIDQNGTQDVTDAFVPNTASSSYHRPLTAMNIASGIPDFMPLLLLDDPNQGYVKDDTMFVKIIVVDK